MAVTKPTRDQIIEAADQLFYSQGFEHTSFADIASAVKISRGNFYYHFKTKDEILDAVIALRLANTRKMLERWESEGGDPAARIRCFIDILIAKHEDHGAWLSGRHALRGAGEARSCRATARGRAVHSVSRLAEPPVRRAPFVAENVVSAEIIEIEPGRTDERLGFLKG